MNERIKEIRQTVGLTQAEFAEKINLSRNYVAMMEIGQREPSARTISDICKGFNVNETWLRTGTGEMLRPQRRVEEIRQNEGLTQAGFSERLNQAMKIRSLKQVDVLEAAKPYCEKYGIKLTKSDLSQYVSGKVEPRQEKLTILSLALSVSEAWLMGYDVSMERKGGTKANDDKTGSAPQIAPQEAARFFHSLLDGMPDSEIVLLYQNLRDHFLRDGK